MPSIQKLLQDANFLSTLREYDRDNIPPRIIDKVRTTYTSSEEFSPAIAAKASSAAEGLCKWVFAMDSYDRVAKIVAPKKLALAEAEQDVSLVSSTFCISHAPHFLTFFPLPVIFIFSAV